MFYKFAREAGLADGTSEASANIQAIYLDTAPSIANDAQLDFSHFLVAVVKLAKHVMPGEDSGLGDLTVMETEPPRPFAQAVIWALRDHLLPLCERLSQGQIVGSPPSRTTSSSMDALINRMEGGLKLLFEHYTLPGKQTVAMKELHMLCGDSRIVPFFVAEPEVAKLVRLTLRETSRTSTDLEVECGCCANHPLNFAVQLNFDKFVEWLSTVSMFAFSKPHVP